MGQRTQLSEEMKRLDHLLDRRHPRSRRSSRAAPSCAKSSAPRCPQILASACVHGDFQLSNILFKDREVGALIDWEISLIGPTLLDLGWICFFADRASFM